VAFWAFHAGRSKGQAEGQEAANSNYYASEAERQIQGYCLGLGPSDLRECIRDAIETQNESQRAESDLVAQRDAARWGLLSLALSGLGTLLSGGALVGLFASLAQTKRAISDTREIGEAQTRAYLSLKIKHLDVNVVSNEDGSNLAVVIQVEVENSGSTPAYSPVIHFSIEETQPQDVIALPEPETLQRSPLSTSFIAAHDAHKNQLSRVFWVVDPVAFQRFRERLVRFSYCVSFWDEFKVARQTPVITGTFVAWPEGMITFMPDKVREPIQG
jgi:hypothetical protein